MVLEVQGPSEFEIAVKNHFEQIFKAPQVEVRFSQYTHLDGNASGYYSNQNRMEMTVDLKFFHNLISENIKRFDVNMQLFKYAYLRSKRIDHNYDMAAYSLTFDLSDCDRLLKELAELNRKFFEESFAEDLEKSICSI